MSFQQGLSGLNATSKNLEVIGNNVANSATFGAKASRAEFADMYASAMNGAGTNNVGIGVTLAAVSQQFTQGNITPTDNPMDLAINGGGFFQVSDGKSPITYTRNGQFKVDRDGYLINNQNQRLMGYPADSSGIILPGKSMPLQLPTAGINPSATDRISMEMNLDARKGVTATGAVPLIDFADPDTYNNATSGIVYDAKGQDIALTYYFQKADTDLWNVFATANGTPVSGTDADPQPLARIQFAPDGSTPTTVDAAGVPTPLGPIVIPSTITALGARTLPISDVQFDLSRATQYGSAFGVTDLSQNGYAPGQLSGISIEDNGIVTARYSNGESKAAGQIEVANFRNPQGLQPLGGNGWARTFASGDPVVGTPGDGNLGVLQSGALEESNVDLTGELVNMITAQRVYQANAQTIKTQDQVLQTLVNLR